MFELQPLQAQESEHTVIRGQSSIELSQKLAAETILFTNLDLA